MSSLWHLNKYLIRYRWRLLTGVLFIILTNVFLIYTPLIVKDSVDFMKTSVETYQAMDTAGQGELELPPVLNDLYAFLGMNHGLSHYDCKNGLQSLVVKIGISLCALYLLLALIKGFFLFFTRQTIIIMSRLIEYDLKNEIYAQYQSLSMSFYKRNDTGDLMNRISEDVSKVRMYLGPAIMYSINLVVLAVLSIWAMMNLNSTLTLWVLAPLPVMSILVYKVSKVINNRSEAVQSQQSKLSSFVQENFSGVRVMKAYGLEDRRSEQFERESMLYRELSLSQVKVDALFMPTIMMLIGLSTILAIFIGGQMIIDGNTGLTFGDLVAFVIYVNLLTWPFAAVGWVTSLVQRAAASQKRINEFLDEESDIESGDLVLTEMKGDIQFEKVTFSYPEASTSALKEVNFRIRPGQTLGIFGKTGSGKSTIAALLTRQFDPSSGKVKLDGHSLDDLDLDSLRDQTGYVPQEVFLFSDSIANNIAFGMKGAVANKEDIEKAGKEAQIDADVKGFPKGYDTILGEWGITLSGGQKQRVSLARAFIRKPKILIFDDSLSAVDTETEEQILGALDKILADRSTVLISHRISTVRRADHIIVLEEGRIVEEGKHEELIHNGGFYAAMERRQSMELVYKD
jgi:ATP-binding cassette subfamily B multidrug efflux pump